MSQNSFQWILLCSMFVSLAYGANMADVPACNYLEATDGSSYSLTTLVEKGPIFFTYDNPKDKYYTQEVEISICATKKCDGHPAAACLCLKSRTKGECEQYSPLGEFSPLDIKAMDDGAGVEITYWSGQSRVGTKLTLLCDYNYVGTEQYEMTPGQLTLITVRTEAACPTRVSISGGLIFMLVVLGVAVLYLVCGVLYNKFSLMKEGCEVMPHSDFWADLPSLVKEGVVYSFSRCRSKPSFENA